MTIQDDGTGVCDCGFRTRFERERKTRLAAEALAEQGVRALGDNKRLLDLVGSIAIAANEAASLEDVLDFTLRRICETIGWQVGHAYKVTGNPLRLEPTAIWYGGTGETLQEFREASESTWLKPGDGLTGSVLNCPEPLWVSYVDAEPRFSRAVLAKRCGLKAGFAFPVMAGLEVAAVLEFFTPQPCERDEAMLRLMGQIGTQLGRVVERKQTEERLIHDASHDPLTRLPNRVLLMDRLTRALARHERHPEQRFAVLFIDLDRFKVVNDSLGHRTGDELILQAAARFSAMLRREDILARCVEDRDADERGTLARFGGDEFVVLLEDLHDTSEAAKVATRLQESLTAPFQIGGAELFISASIGIASSDTGYSRAEDVLRDADLAMYRAKSAGKAQYQVYDVQMHAEAVRRMELENSLRGAFERREFLLYYMPIVDMEEGTVRGFEALVRWQREVEGIVLPGEFISVAEDTGLILRLGAWVLLEACKTLRRWQMMIPGCSGLTMNVNLSPRQFAQPDLVEVVQRVLTETGVEPGLIKLEITETCMMADAERAIDVLGRLRALGVQLSLDDFGTGFSSLSYLHRFPLQNLKIDRSFVSRMTDDTESLAIARTIVRLARDLKLDVTAEGPETHAQVKALQSLGCDYAQGFYYARPLPEAEAEALLRGPLALAPPMLVEAA
ncbi:MAG: EAL domain-containing protein [Acidobacteriota bacterium]